MIQRQNVSFPAADGTTLRGWFHAGKGDKAPGVVMNHGYSATKEMALDGYARIFAEAGFAVLVYDHRGLGESDGEPRRVIDPWMQTRDLLDAIDWLGGQQDVDGQRIGLWGSSFSGGQVILAGTMDARVRGVVANVPFVGDPAAAASAPDDAFEQLAEGVRNAIPAREVLGPIAVVRRPGSEERAVMPQPESAEWFLSWEDKPEARWRNEAWRPAGDTLAAFNPALALRQPGCPVLFVVAEGDTLVTPDIVEAACKLAGERGELRLMPGHHFTPYSGAALAQAADAACRFFERTL